MLTNKKQILITTLFCVLASVTATAQLVPGPYVPYPPSQDSGDTEYGFRIETVLINKQLKHADSISVRKVTQNLNPGDFVQAIEIDAQAMQPGAYFQIIKDQTVIDTLPLTAGLSTISVDIQLRNGVDYKRLIVRSIGTSYVTQMRVIIGEDGDILQPPPPPPPPPPHPGSGSGVESTFLITEPRLPGSNMPIRFDAWSKENGACKALGYERAIPNSTKFSGLTNESVILLDASGRIEKMANMDRITQMTCISRY